MKLKNLISGVLVFLLIFGMTGFVNAVTVNNTYVEIAVSDSTAKFTMGTKQGDPTNANDDNKKLLYGHPSPDTSKTTIKVDGTSYRYGDSGSSMVVVNSPTVSGSSIYTTWYVSSTIRVTQTLSIITSSTTGRADTMEIEYSIENTDTSSHEVGLRIMMDTMLGSNDYAPFKVPGTGDVTTEKEFTSSNMPQYWQAFDSLSNPTIISQGTLIGGSATTPDNFALVNWPGITDTYWDYTITPTKSTGDSAVALYWNPVTISPGQTLTYKTYYGLGKVTISAGNLTLGLTAPSSVSNCTNFTVVAYVSNVGGSTANDVVATISVPACLTLSSGETAAKNLGSIASGSDNQTSWILEPSGSNCGNNTLEVTVTSSNVDSNTASVVIEVPEECCTTTTTTTTSTTTTTGPSTTTTTLPSGTVIFSDTMESGTNGWTSTGFWHQKTNPQTTCIISDINPRLVSLPDDGCLPTAYSGSTVWWYGEDATGTFIGSDYNSNAQTSKNGGTSTSSNQGGLISPTIDLTGASGATLTPMFWYEIEGVDVDRFDMMRVYISTDAGSTWTLLRSINPIDDVDGEYFRPYSSGGLGEVGVWITQQFDLSSYSGEQVKIKFEFRTEDGLYNGFRGWLIDDVSITTEGVISPTIISITPSTGITGTIIYIIGTNFMSGATVSIGGYQSDTVSVVGSLLIHATVPSQLTSGTYDLTVTNPNGYSDTLASGFTVTSTQPPEITSITPDSGLNTEETTVTISGSNFQTGATVEIASTLLTNVVVTSSSTITATVPMGLPTGYQNVKVTNPDSQYDLLVGGFYVTSTVTTTTTTTLPASGVIVTRNLPTSVTPGASEEVTLTVNVDETNLPTGVIINENVPSGWEIISSTPAYISHLTDTQYKWIFSEVGGNVADTTITYTVSVPSDASGTATFSGTVETTFGINDITGDTTVTVLGEITNVEVTRDLPNSASAGSSFDVTLGMDINETNLPSGVIIIENIPSGFNITSATPSYSQHPSATQYKWLFYGGIEDTTITYTISVPSDALGTATFSGVVETTSTSGDVLGDTELTITTVPGDTDGDGDVNDLELLAFIDQWFQGTVNDLDLLTAIEYWST